MMKKCLIHFLCALGLVLVTLLTPFTQKVQAETGLDLGVQTTGNLSGTGDVKYYEVNISSGEHLVVILDGNDNYNSYSLYIKFASLPTTTDYDDKGDLPNADQGVEIANTQAGTYYVMVRSTSGSGNFTITAHTSTTFPTLTLGTSKAASLQGTYDVKYYQVSVSAGEHLMVVLDGSNNYNVYDLYIKFASLPTTTDYDDKGDLPNADQGVEIASTQAGTYYVMARSTSGSGNFTITAHTSTTFPTLTLGTSKAASLQGTYDVKYYQVSVTAGKHLSVVLNGSDNYNSYDLYIKFASLPTTTDYDDKGDLPNADQGVEIASTQAGTYYVMVRSTSGSGNFTIVAHTSTTFPTLTLGTSKAASLQGTYDVKYYQVSVSAGEHLMVVLDGSNNYNVYDLYIKFASLPTTTDYDDKGDLPNADQGVEIASTQAGTYYVMARSTSGSGNFTIVAHTSTTFPTLTLGTSKAASLQGTYDIKYYQVSVTAGKHLFVVLDANDNYNSYDLYIKFASLPTTTDYDDKGDLPNADQGVEITSTQAGTYYVMVRSTSGSGNFTIGAHTNTTFPTLKLGTSKAASLQGTYDVKYYQVSVSAGKHLVVILDGSNNYNVYDLYIKFASLPTTTDYDDKGDSAKADQIVEIASTKKGTYYIMVRSTSGGGNFAAVAHYQFTTTFNSTGSQDGWILESSETSGKGGTINAAETTFRLGDDASDRQYRAILSFNTASLPDNAVIKSAVLKIKQSGSPVGSNPFSVLGSLYAGIRKGYFGSSSSLQTADFNATASAEKIATFGKTPTSGWYRATLTSTGRKYINKTSLTQFRLAFAKDDNDDRGADYMKFISGNASSNKPSLTITYFSP